jgi:hypothetical protein
MSRRPVMVVTYSLVDSTLVVSAPVPKRLPPMSRGQSLRLAETLVRGRRQYALTDEAQAEREAELRALEDREELLDQAAALLERSHCLEVGRRKVEQARRTPGHNTVKVKRSALALAVRRCHEEHPGLSFNSVCEIVRKDERWKRKYKSTWSIKRAAADAELWVRGAWFDA